MPATLDLFFVDELIAVRHLQHGGEPGAPEIKDGHRVGTSINRSCMVMLSAQLQTFVEDVFVECSAVVLPKLADKEEYRGNIGIWGNPNPRNIDRLFCRLGPADILSGLSWKKCANATVKNRLDHLNQIRNRIAHGAEHITVDKKPISLSLAVVKGYRNFVDQFSRRFEAHALKGVRN